MSEQQNGVDASVVGASSVRWQGSRQISAWGRSGLLAGLCHIALGQIALLCVSLTAIAQDDDAKAKSAAARPNIVLIMADDMGFECLGCNGSTYATPHLDRLAAEGLRFVHCYSQPLCTPSRVKIMTGQYNFRNYSEFGYLSPDARTFGHVLQEAGYRTCIAGKWQLNGLSYNLPGNDNPQRPFAAGFDAACLWQVTKTRRAGERYADPLLEKNGKVSRLQGEYGPQVFADFVCDFIEENRDEPFLVYYPMVLTHDPFVPTPDSPEWKSGNRYRKNKRFFADMVAYTDRVVGQIDAKLDELGLRDNTLLMFTADNGTKIGISSPMQDGSIVAGGKGTMPNAGTHVPFVASWPGTAPRGKVNTDLIDFSDFFVTLADLAGRPEQAADADGRSFYAQLRGQSGTPRQFAFCHYVPRWGRLDKHRGRYVRTQSFKLYLDGRLFNVPADVLEQSALALGDLTADRARSQLQRVLESMPAWNLRPRIPTSVSPTATTVP